MDTADKCCRLVGEIVSYFEDGVCMDTHAKTYIDTCLPDISFQDLAYRICNTPDSDDAPLIELIFFPDEALQMRLEPLLESDTFDIEDENKIVNLLHEAGVQTTLRETGHNAGISIKIPTTALTSLVRRLNISRRIPKELSAAIKTIRPLIETYRVKVKLRNTRFAFSPKVTSFLDCFFGRIKRTDKNFRDCLGLVLAVLDEPKHESDPYLLLKNRRDLFIRAKRAAAEFTRKLQRSNMETLMQLGIRAPEISMEDAERKIDLLERIMEATKPDENMM